MDDVAQTKSDEGPRRFAYFVLRIQWSGPGAVGGLTGVLERLGSGWARRFDGSDELLALLIDGAEVASSSKSRPGKE